MIPMLSSKSLVIWARVYEMVGLSRLFVNRMNSTARATEQAVALCQRINRKSDNHTVKNTYMDPSAKSSVVSIFSHLDTSICQTGYIGMAMVMTSRIGTMNAVLRLTA